MNWRTRLVIGANLSVCWSWVRHDIAIGILICLGLTAIFSGRLYGTVSPIGFHDLCVQQVIQAVGPLHQA
jgi:hypothetical protein